MTTTAMEAAQTRTGEMGRWEASGCPLTVEYSLAVMEELRVRAEEFFQKIPHGGLEVGALLLGTREGNTVRVLEWRPMECEHAKGPGFVLSERDRASLQMLIDRCATASELRGLEPVGWFHTHTRSKIFLSPEDLAIQDEFFPERWQLALVMHLAKNKPQQAGFFYRAADGSVHADASIHEFTVLPNPSVLVRGRRKSSAPAADGKDQRAPKRERTEARPSEAAPPAATPAAATAGPWVEDFGAGTNRPVPSWVDRFAEAAPAPSAVEVMPAPNPIRRLGPARRRRWWWSWQYLAVLLVVGVIAGLAVPQWLNQKAAASFLRVEAMEDQLFIMWDQNAPAARTADLGMLEINDGGARRQVSLNPESIRRGSVTYVRTAADVEVRLTLFQGGNPVVREYGRYLGTQGASGAERPAIESDLKRLREAIEQEKERGKKLSESVKELEQPEAAPPAQRKRRR